jgi:N6-L-threonylcarbamoyladenine synthase
MYLALETSCDDTCAAVLAADGQPLSSVVSSQLVHAEYAGVVPELASREHLRLGPTTIRLALEQAGCALGEIRGIAVTQGPGLVGCLLVGLGLGKGLALSRGLPVVGVNHIDGHIHAIRAVRGWAPPFVALVASGGHTELLYAEAWGRYRLLGATRDDAAGEAFDKVAKLLGLGYPGGPIVDRLAQRGRGDAVEFPRAYLDVERGNLDVSFSGLKTAVKVHVERHPIPEDRTAAETTVADLCASFQAALVDVLVAKVEAAVRQTQAPRVLVSGGVACNSFLRARMEALGRIRGFEVAFPPPKLCADNAVMIGLAGLTRLLDGADDGMGLSALPNLDDFPAFAPPRS